MVKTSKIIILIIAITPTVFSGCVDKDAQRQEEYEKCTSVSSPGNNIIAMLIYAIVVTIIAVFATIQIGNVVEKLK